MNTLISRFRRPLVALVAGAALAVVLGASNDAQAGWGYGNSYRYGYRGPVYHAPSVHYDRLYHHDYSHWTPSRGWHSHGHYHSVPHYTPGHFDYSHGNHLHLNPRYHHGHGHW